MKTAIRKMGNSHSVIIPKPLLAEVWAMAAAHGPNSGVVPIRTRNGKKRGEIWLARLDPTGEREIRKSQLRRAVSAPQDCPGQCYVC